MPHFRLKNDPHPPTLTAELEVDEMGDLELVINGIRVAFISATSGNLFRYWLSDEETTQLSSNGLSIGADNRVYDGTHDSPKGDNE